MPLMRRLREDESGTSLLILVFALVVLLGFAAFAVDAAGAWALKRQDQSAADTGAIAAGLFTAGKTKAQAISDATDEVIRITYNTVDPNMTQAEWRTEWINCADGSKPAIFTDVGISDCISFSSNLGKIRVQTPDIPWPTAFGTVLGVDEIQTAAFAEVDTELADNGGVMPFALPGNAAGAQEICLKTGPQPDVAPCDGPATGNFGFADFSKFGDPAAGIPSVCQGGNDRLEDNIALGIDHILSTADVYPPVVPADIFEDVDACNDGNINAQPWNFDTQTGNVAQALDDGLVDVTGNGVPGRLTRPAPSQEQVRGHWIDDTPLWNYLTVNCPVGPATPTSHEEMKTCLGAYGSGEWFSEALGNSPRFGWVPLVYEWDLGPGGARVTIQEFRPVYIQTTFWGCGPAGCDVEWDPGEADASMGPNNIRVEAATAIQIPFDALPESLKLAAPGTPGQVFYLLSR
jgi:hypothetical protein